MGRNEGRLIAVCGLDCTDCDIRRVPTDAEAGERVVAWFKEMGWLEESEGVTEVIERSMYCKGCRGDRMVHWSPECGILRCCVDEKGLGFCYKCDKFPCEQLREWGEKGGKYEKALSRLQRMRKAAAV